jgi:class 3 adenylate cyclase
LNCPACGHQNRAGKPVARTDAPAAYTPRHLAERILNQRAALEGERRNVTVLFCDVEGYTAMSEKLDEEDIYANMQGFLAKMLDAVRSARRWRSSVSWEAACLVGSGSTAARS